MRLAKNILQAAFFQVTGSKFKVQGLCRLCHPERSRLYLNERIKRGFVEPLGEKWIYPQDYY